MNDSDKNEIDLTLMQMEARIVAESVTFLDGGNSEFGQQSIKEIAEKYNLTGLS